MIHHVTIPLVTIPWHAFPWSVHNQGNTKIFLEGYFNFRILVFSGAFVLTSEAFLFMNNRLLLWPLSDLGRIMILQLGVKSWPDVLRLIDFNWNRLALGSNTIAVIRAVCTNWIIEANSGESTQALFVVSVRYSFLQVISFPALTELVEARDLKRLGDLRTRQLFVITPEFLLIHG